MHRRCVVSTFFFFQAEDGIRDLVRSRGLGDVYKRQVLDLNFSGMPEEIFPEKSVLKFLILLEIRFITKPVSYTHLTLPTSDLV